MTAFAILAMFFIQHYETWDPDGDPVGRGEGGEEEEEGGGGDAREEEEYRPGISIQIDRG